MPLLNHDRIETLSWLKAVVAAAVLLPLSLYALAVWYLHSQAVTNASFRIERATRVGEEHALKIFENSSSLLTRTTDLLGKETSEQLRAHEPELHAQLKRMTAGLPQMQGIFVIDEAGTMVVTDRRSPPPTQLNFSDRPSFMHHAGNGSQPYVSELLTSRATHELFFDVSVRRSLPDGAFSGTLSASMAPKYFAEFYRELTGDDRELNIALVRFDGSVLARWPNTPSATDQAGVEPTRMQLGQAASSIRAERSDLPDGETGLLASRQINGYPVHVVAWIDDDAIRSVWLHQAALLGALLLPVTIGLVASARIALLKTWRSLEDAASLRAEIRQREMVEETLRQAQKLEAMGRLTGGVAHDFNNLLMILSNSLFILLRMNPDIKGRNHAGAMERAVAAGAKLTRQLLSFSRRQPFRPELVRLQDTVPAILDLIRPAVGSSIAVTGDVAAETMPVEVDMAELELALVNLGINAKDAMPGGGKLVISAGNVAAGREPAGLAGPLVQLTVKDQGKGISEEHLARVFEPFFTTKPPGHGTGLGLSQVYGFCQRAGGTAAVESREGEGTSVHLYLPGRLTDMPTSETDLPKQEQRLGLRVLLAEDNGDVAGATIAVLEILGCTVRHVGTGDEAKRILDADSKSFDLLLSDIVMPGALNGLALARETMAGHPDLPVLLMSGYSEFGAEAVAAGLHVVPKPCTPAVLASAIRKARAKGGTP